MHILFLEDDDMTNDIVSEILSELGAKIVSTKTINKTKKFLKQEKFDLFLADLIIGATNSSKLIKLAIESKIRVVVITAESRANKMLENVPVEYVLFKPFDITKIEEVIFKKNIDIYK